MKEIEVNKTNRIYAVRDAPLATVYKVKSDGRKDKVALCPERCVVDNEFKIPIDKIDKKWYIELAKKRAEEFKVSRRKEMPRTKTDEIKETEVTETEKSVTEAKSFYERLLDFFTDIGNESFLTDGYNSNQKYDYTKSATYKATVRKYCVKHKLLFTMDDVYIQSETGNKSDKMVLMNYQGVIALTDVLNPENIRKWVVWEQGADMGDKAVSKAKTLAIKNWVKANALVFDGQDEPEADAEPISTDVTVVKSTNKYVSKGEHAKAIDTVTKSEPATKEQKERLIYLINLIREKTGNTNFGEKVVDYLNSKTLSSENFAIYEARLESEATAYGIEV